MVPVRVISSVVVVLGGCAMRYSREFIEQVKKSVRIEEIVRETIPLKAVGKVLQGHCPEHPDETPSFTVFPETQSFFCFSCRKGSRENGRSSDVIAFLRERRGMAFPQAVAYLAARAGLDPHAPPHPPASQPPPSQASRAAPARATGRATPPPPGVTSHSQANHTDRHAELLDRAASFYHFLLRQPIGRHALDYLTKSRGLSDELIDHFELGFAPGRRYLLSHLTKQGFSTPQCLGAGLVTDRRGDQLYDFLWGGVVTIPHYIHGHVQAFTIKDPDPTRLAQKRRLAYGLGEKDHFFNQDVLEHHDSIILVEGENDLFAIRQLTPHQNVVALCSCEMTRPQWTRLQHSAVRTIFLCLDRDTRGQQATRKLYLQLRKHGYQVFAIRWRGPKDIDQFLRHLFFPDREFDRLLQPAQADRSTPRTVTPRRPPRRTKGGAR